MDSSNQFEASSLLEKYLRLLFYRDVLSQNADGTGLHQRLAGANATAAAMATLFFWHLRSVDSFEEVNFNLFKQLSQSCKDPEVREAVPELLELCAEFAFDSMTRMKSKKELFWSMVSVAAGVEGDQDFERALDSALSKLNTVKAKRRLLSFVVQTFEDRLDDNVVCKTLPSTKNIVYDFILDTLVVVSKLDSQLDASKLLFERLFQSNEQAE